LYNKRHLSTTILAPTDSSPTTSGTDVCVSFSSQPSDLLVSNDPQSPVFSPVSSVISPVSSDLVVSTDPQSSDISSVSSDFVATTDPQPLISPVSDLVVSTDPQLSVTSPVSSDLLY
jgi:hypothetical protein